ncbi:MAG: PASTA domain-containing protein [Anaerolineales bacterium]|nr:PASTA domain-containing protein [Anaerolineales bacterium]
MAKKQTAQVLKFDGTSTYIRLGPANSLGLTNNDFTIEAWVRADDLSGTDKTIMGNDQGTLNNGLHLILRDRRPYFGFYMNDQAGRTELAPKLWYHLAFRFTKSTGEQAIFVNGVLDASSVGHVPFQGISDLLIGRWNGGNYFNGAMTEIRVWNIARPAQAIRADMQKRLQGTEPGLMAYYRLDTDAGAVVPDNTQRVANGLMNGDPAWVDVPPPFEWAIKQALVFDGSQDRLSVYPFNTFPETELTFECWVRSGNRSKAGTLISYANAQTDDAFLVLDLRNVKPTVNQEGQQSGVAFNDGKWHHLAVTWRSTTGRMVLYKDGESVYEAELSKGRPILNGGSIVLGQEQDAVLARFDPSQGFKGEMAEVRLWNKVRGVTELRGTMKTRLAGDEDGLVGYWPLNDFPQLTVRDLSPSKKDLTSNGPLWQEPGGPIPSDTNRFVTLDGVDDFLTVPPAEWFEGDFTVESWVYLRKIGNWVRLMDFGNGPGQDNVLIALSRGTTGLLGLHVYNSTGGGARVDTSVPMPVQRWAHFAATFKGDTVALYLNGQEVFRQGGFVPPIKIQRRLNYIGRSHWAADALANAMLAEFRIWRRARTREEILNDRDRRLTGTEPDLVGCWHLDDGKSSTARNAVNKDFDATLNGATWEKPDAAVPSDSGRVLTLDGVDDYVSVVIDLPETEVTHELWFRTSDPEAGIFSVTDQDLGVGGHDRHLFLRGGNLFARLWNHEVIGTSGLTLADTQWHHIAHVFGNSAGGQRLYVDGRLVASGNKPASDFVWQKRINFGFSPDAAHPYFKGQLCEVRVWNRTRSVEEIQAAMFKQLPGHTPNLIGYWRLDETQGSLAKDTSEFERDGVLSGPAWQAIDLPIPTTTNKVLMLDGADDFSQVDTFRWENRGPVTVEFWAKVNEIDVQPPTASGNFFSVGKQDGSNRFLAHVPWGDQNLIWDYGNYAGAGRVSVNYAPYIDNWTHVALVSQGANGNFMGIYLNGRLVAATNRSDAPQVNLRGVWIGQGPHGSQKGQVADFRIWNFMRSQAEIRATMYTRLNGTEPGLVGYWPLDGNGQDGLGLRPGTLNAGAWDKLDAPIQPTLADVLTPLQTATFDGAGDYISVPNADVLNMSQTLTVEAWVKPTNNKPEVPMSPVVAKHGEATGWDLRCGGGKAEFMVTINRMHYQAMADQVDLGQWTHVVGVYNGQAIQLYLNGVLKASTPITGPITPYFGDLNIGRNSRWTDRLFAGQIAELRVWNTPRSLAEIHTFMLRRLNGDETGLVAYWKLNDGNVERAEDSSKNKLVGIQHGVDWTPSELPLAIITVEQEVQINLDAELKKIRLERDDLRQQLENTQAQLEALTQQARALEQALEATRAAQTQELTQLQEEQRRKIAELEQQHTERLDSLSADGPVTLTNLIKNANDQITRAREELLKQGGNYRLGRVTMELKMLPTAAGTSMIFPKPEEMGTIPELSSVNLDFAPKEVAETPRDLGVEVPDVKGYTELLAQRKLREAGFVMEVIYQAVTVEEGKPSMEDRVVNQTPKPKERAQPFSTITVFIGKKS